MNISEILKNNQRAFRPLFQPDLTQQNTYFLDFSVNNPALEKVDLTHTPSLHQYVSDLVKNAGKHYGYGGYMEDREVYRRSALFSGGSDEARSIHLGIDVWTEAGKEVHLPFDGTIHSFQNNDSFGDYGPTIIVEHILESVRFFTLYGHLSLDSLDGLSEGMSLTAGQVLCKVGDAPDNGDWPPHLHFQVMSDMMGKKGDFPGVCYKREMEKFRDICPNPVVFFPELE
jgi:peptidoglycan LD-endopeptidase LytH